MKTKILLSALLISQVVISQTRDCFCNDLFEKDLKTKYTTFNSQNSKNILLKYFKSNITTRQQMKNDNSLEASVSTVIKSLPTKFGLGTSSSSSAQKYYYLHKEITENNYVSDENLQTLSVSIIPDEAFTSYNNCLKLCTNEDGITLRNVSTQENLIVLELRFNSIPSGSKISIKDAIYSTGTVIGNKKFDENTEVMDGQTLYEHIKLRPNEDFTASISFNEAVKSASISIGNSKIKKSTDSPIGTIVASVLNYNQFLDVNGLKFHTDINKTIWVPCDGRDVGTKSGTFGAYNGGKVPDLRGLFLRGANNMGNIDATVPTINNNNMNPDNTLVGKVQQDSFKRHNHTLGDAGRADWDGNGLANKQRIRHDGSGGGIITSTSGNSSETRPKNMTVYYYIKIR